MSVCLRCKHCHSENILEEKSFYHSEIKNGRWKVMFNCEDCHGASVVMIVNMGLDISLRKLTRMRVSHKNFRYLFVKELKRAMRLQEDVRNGK